MSELLCHRSGPAGRGADRRSAVQAVPALFLCRRYALSLRFAQRCRSEDRRVPAWWRRRESNPRPKVFRNDIYMHIRVVGGNPRPKAPFPLSVPRPHQPGESRLGTYPLCSPTAREDRRQSPPRSTPFPARQAWSGRTWLLKQPVPVQCWLLFCFHRLREVDPRHAIVASYTLVEPSTPPLFARLRRQVRS